MRILVVLFMPAFLLTQVPVTPASLAITHVMVIDTAVGSARGDMTVVIDGPRIVTVGESSTVEVPRAATVIDGRGKFLIPGLWDMHVHMFNNAVGAGTDNREYFLPLLVANGVLGVRDMWTDPEDIQVARRWNTEIAAGRLLGPQVMVSSRIVDGAPARHANSLVVRDAEQAREAVRALKAAGAGFIKVYWDLSRDAYFAIADESKKQGIPFEGHVPFAVTAEEASDAGQRTIEHMTGIAIACSDRQAGRGSYDATRCAALADRFRRNGTWLVPTAVGFWRPAGVDPNARRRYGPPQGSGGVRQQLPMLDQVPAPRFRQAMRQAGRFLAGTDISNGRPWILPGFSLHDELALFVEQGHTAVEALQAATSNAAQYRGALDDSGTVEPKKRADLVLLDADPLADIRHTSRINAVILNGRLLDRTRLDHLLAEGEAAASKLKPPPPPPTVTFVITAAGNTATGFAGTWQSDFQGQASVDLKVDGTKVTGTIQAAPEPSQIFDGRIDGNTMTFKATSPDGARTVTFTGTVTGNELDFTRDVEVVAGGNPGGQGLFGSAGARRFSASRVK